MPTTIEAYRSLTRARRPIEAERQRAERVRERDLAQSILHHPGWADYDRQMRTEIARLTEQGLALRDRMVTGPEVGDALTDLKLRAARVEGARQALTEALESVRRAGGDEQGLSSEEHRD